MAKAYRMQFKLSTVLSVTIGITISFVIMLLLSILFAISISNEYLNINMIPYCVWATWVVSVFCGSFLTYKIGENKGITSIVLIVGGSFLALTGIALLFYEGLTGGFFAGIAGCAAGGVLSILLCNRPKKPTHRKARRGRSR